MSCRSTPSLRRVVGEQMRISVYAVVLCAGACIAASGLSAQDTSGAPGVASAVRAANSRFAGVWTLVAEETRDTTNQVVPRGPNAGSGGRIGYIAYDPAG